MKRAKLADAVYATGLSLVVGGAVAASPLDEAVSATVTGGIALPAAPAQGAVTFAAGATSIVLGAGLMLASRWMR